MGRFLINGTLAACGYSWTVIPDERINAYMATLEAATLAGTSKVPRRESPAAVYPVPTYAMRRARSTAAGARSMTRRYARVGPSGWRLPCSQCRRVLPLPERYVISQVR
jgi:hypothetical protein